MTKGFSIYLDLLRFLAALEVALFHLGLGPSGGLGQGGLTRWGHEAVVIFFVLSGFVISHAAQTRDTTFLDFTASRLSRVYSVALPCILLTVAFDAIGYRIAADVYQGINFETAETHTFSRILISVLMLNNSWVPVQMFSNSPYWSICCEVWYYFIFAAFVYGAGAKRWVLVGVLAVIAGPRTLASFPIWLLGVWAYQQSKSCQWTAVMTWLAFLQPVFVLAVYDQFNLGDLAYQIMAAHVDPHWLDMSSAFVLTDFWIGVSFAVHLLAAKQLEPTLLRWLHWAEPAIRWGAARSFTLYLMHFPLMLMLTAVLSHVVSGLLLAVLVTCGTIALPVLMGSAIEKQRHILRPCVQRGLLHYFPRMAPSEAVTA